MVVRQVRALDASRARRIAVNAAPEGEFMLTLVPESDEQFLGQVRLRALAARAD
ncbi:MAG: hypothetical protein R3229_00450 [Alphaproteobacteria bacterium]|nr:hypothetical protein [Alphaproteobacteria bacterium]